MELYRAASVDVRSSVRKCGVVDSISRCFFFTGFHGDVTRARLAAGLSLLQGQQLHATAILVGVVIIIDRDSAIPCSLI